MNRADRHPTDDGDSKGSQEYYLSSLGRSSDPTGGILARIFGDFRSIHEQKTAGEETYKHQVDESSEGHRFEDHDFMRHKPGGPDTLPGWTTARKWMHF